MTTTAPAGASAPAAGPTVLGWFEPGTDEWHAARAAGIGGSEIAAVMGISPYESRFSLWHRKQGLIAPVEESEEMYWGKVHEPAICDRFADLHPDWAVCESGTYAAVERPWQIANPDRVLHPMNKPEEWIPPAVLEAKTARDDHGWGKPGTDDIPVHYRAQCLWYMDVLGARTCHVAVLIAGSEFREYVVEYDETDALAMRTAGAEFMRTLAAGERPDIDGHSATFQTIKALPDGQDDIDIEVSTARRDRYFAALDAATQAEEEKRAAAGLLLDEIGTGRRAVCERRTVATRTVRAGRTYSLQPAWNRSTS
ncbi:YqaJ viral recombinase family protein [Streptomyces sp. NBC_00378]|uniref:YqaJ viral recombinase family nuclease n=1 Tax=unclassified Streptomyces TaxID=2593676 RepID=UPI002257C9D1|nr:MULTISPECIES: YqaJ viral recombinase family protein [unclassified Streptomyces]MCX5112177.1 YqaJ viral recombinase family protein [Streptomyces sp. NBC_00378]MCX5114628.1 YqaJ viral recombinase family protein [Streptomyces sp. NBC_00378]